jgi:tartrate dehydrogenase/decarboxylase/D-malate dehydrogenase
LVGTGKANPTATLFAAAMMLDYLGENEQSTRLRTAVEICIANGKVTPDLGGTLTTNGMTEKVIEYL